MDASFLILAAALELVEGGVSFALNADPQTVDPARCVFVTLTARAPADTAVVLPDLSTRVRGFSDAEAFAEEPVTGKDGQITQTVNWKLLPEPCAPSYRIAPFVVDVTRRGTNESFVAGPVYFNQPVARPSVEGGLQIDPQPDRPPLGWKGILRLTCWILGGLVALGLVAFVVRLLARRVKEHFMSPIERARAELDRLLAKGLPARGLFKDFYVELTLVVRRYVQRQHGVKAPHLTTEEFFEATRQSPSFPQSTLDLLIDFLRKADMVKFAGVEASTETAETATAAARAYLEKDEEIVRRRKGAEK